MISRTAGPDLNKEQPEQLSHGFSSAKRVLG